MQTYINCYLPGLFMFAMGDLQRRFLNSMGYTYVPLVCQFISIALHGFWLYVFTSHFGLGIYGIGLAGVLTNTTSCGLMVAYSSCIEEIKECIFWPDGRSFYGLWMYLKIAIPAALMTCTDWWVFELMIFTSGLFGVYYQAAQIVMMNITMFFYFVALGFGVVSTQLVGFHLGKGDLKSARQYLRVV